MRELTEDLMLTGVAEGFMESVQGLDDLTVRVPELSTEQLGTGYAMIKAYEKNFDALVKRVRDEFIGGQFEDKEYMKNGRLFLEAKETDSKGNPQIEFSDGTLLKASKSQSVSFDEAMARDVLEEYGLTELGSDKTITVQQQSLPDFIDFLTTALKDHSQIGYMSVEEVEQKLQDTFIVDYRPNKEKIEALILTKQLPSEAVDGMFTTKDSYSLLVSKNPYKPKKR